MPSNTVYNPEKTADFVKSKLNFNGQSIRGEVETSQTTEADYTLADDHLLTGGVLLVKEAKIGDKVSLQIVHPTFGVVNEFVKEYGLAEDQQVQFSLNLEYPAKLATGLKIRCKYEASSDPAKRQFVLNLLLHKVLE